MCKTIHNNVKTVITKIFPNKNLIISHTEWENFKQGRLKIKC